MTVHVRSLQAIAMVSDACLSAGSIVPAERALSQHVSPSATAYVETGVLGPSAGILGRSVLSQSSEANGVVAVCCAGSAWASVNPRFSVALPL